MSARKTRFTLIELLVVVSIIAVLAAMLLPALGRARRIAVRTACASNMHQLGLAYTDYNGTWNEAFPPQFSNKLYTPTSDFPYLWSDYFFVHHLAVDMGMQDNILLAQNRIFAPKVSGVNDKTGAPGAFRSTVFSCPAFTPGSEPVHRGYLNYAQNGQADTTPANRWVQPDETSLLVDTHNQPYMSSSTEARIRWICNRHALSTNILFGDGHMESRAAPDVYFTFRPSTTGTRFWSPE